MTVRLHPLECRWIEKLPDIQPWLISIWSTWIVIWLLWGCSEAVMSGNLPCCKMQTLVVTAFCHFGGLKLPSRLLLHVWQGQYWTKVVKTRVIHRFRLLHKIQLNNLNFESYWLVDLKFRAPDWSKFKLFQRICCKFVGNRNLCTALNQTTLVFLLCLVNWI